jgi:ABC-2 type transport system ATP-binding protein
MNEIIRTENLTKQFREVKAVKDLSISIKKGEIYGFLGLNGAGKTTTIRMLLGMIWPTAGNAYIKGRKIIPGRDKIWADTGHVVEVPYSYPELTVRENLQITAKLRSINERKAVDTIIEKLKLTEYAERKAKNLSQGNSQRLGLAKALIHNPEILILDEPSNSLDPVGIVEIRELLLDLSINKGVTIFISSHILGEISKIATRIGIINDGILIQENDTAHLEKLRTKRLLTDAANKQKAIDILNINNLSTEITEEGHISIINEHAINHPDEISEMMVRNGVPPTLLKVEVEDLESYFLKTIGMKGGAL